MAELKWVRNLSKVFNKYAIDSIFPEEVIRIRQMFVRLENQMNKNGRRFAMLSGSSSEGFQFSTSDMDYMIVYMDTVVLTENYLYHHAIKDDTSVLMMETDKSRPGFCLLRLFSPYIKSNPIDEICIKYLDGLYLASTFWRNGIPKSIPGSKVHGPCENGFPIGQEVDLAHCLKCNKWPGRARPCINRLARAGWPSRDVLADIVRNGCHLVPIGDKTSDKEFLEWRISFSVAETTLVHQMNHCQFLCYGLLKIFLKEVINTREDVNGLLCSYFLKTVVFWEITSNRSPWMIDNFLVRFWDCLRRLMSWVKNGYCPNFFIPENNMFMGKIHGRSQRVLLHYLTALYNSGYNCIPVCKCSSCTIVLRQPRLANLGFGRIRIDKMTHDFCIIKQFTSRVSFISEVLVILRQISKLHGMKCQHGIDPMILDRFLRLNVQNLSMVYALESFGSLRFSNKSKYNLVSKSMNVIKENAFDVSTHRLISAIILYRLRILKHSSRILLNLRDRFRVSRVIYPCSTEPEIYRAKGGDNLPFEIMMRKSFASPLTLVKNVSLTELNIEHEAYNCILYEPPVFIELLLFLNYYRMSMYKEAYIELHKIKSIIYKRSLMPHQSTMAWEVLGICQEMRGYIHDAFESYMEALRDPNFSLIHKACRKRMQNLQEKCGDFFIRS